jgi:hypothetical protein
MLHHVLQGFEHVAIAQVPGVIGALVHDAIILFSGADHASVLGRIGEVLAILGRVIKLTGQDILKLGHNIVFAGIALPAQHGHSIPGGLAVPRSQAAIAPSGGCGRLRIDLVQIGQHFGD